MCHNSLFLTTLLHESPTQYNPKWRTVDSIIICAPQRQCCCCRQLPEADTASSSAPSSPRHKHARHDNVEEQEETSTSNAPPAAGKASAQPAKSSRSKTITRGPSKRPALPSSDTAASWSTSDQQGAGQAPDQVHNNDNNNQNVYLASRHQVHMNCHLSMLGWRLLEPLKMSI